MSVWWYITEYKHSLCFIRLPVNAHLKYRTNFFSKFSRYCQRSLFLFPLPASKREPIVFPFFILVPPNWTAREDLCLYDYLWSFNLGKMTCFYQLESESMEGQRIHHKGKKKKILGGYSKLCCLNIQYLDFLSSY